MDSSAIVVDGPSGHDARPLAIGALALVARAEAVLARARATRRARTRALVLSPPAPSREVLRVADLAIDVGARTVRRRGRVIPLTRTEFALLLYLVRHRGRVVTQRELLGAAFARDHDARSRTVVMHVSTLRRKLGDGSARAAIIRTVWGQGYRVDG